MSGVTIGTSTTGSLKVSITKPDGTALVAATSMGTSGGYIDVKSLPATGTYTILVDPQLAVIGSATLQLYDVPADLTPSITAGGAPVTITTTIPGQNAKLTFAGTAGRRISLTVSGVTIGTSTTGSLKVSITKPDGTPSSPPRAWARAAATSTSSRCPPRARTRSSSIRRALRSARPRCSSTTSPPMRAPPSPRGSAPHGHDHDSGPEREAHLRGHGRAAHQPECRPVCCSLKVWITKPDGTALVAATSMGTSGGYIDVKSLPATGTYTILVTRS